MIIVSIIGLLGTFAIYLIFECYWKRKYRIFQAGKEKFLVEHSCFGLIWSSLHTTYDDKPAIYDSHREALRTLERHYEKLYTALQDKQNYTQKIFAPSFNEYLTMKTNHEGEKKVLELLDRIQKENPKIFDSYISLKKETDNG